MPPPGKIFLLCFCFFASFSTRVNAQGQAANWYFGDKTGISFNGGTVNVLTDNSLKTYNTTGSISDASGNLLFYTDGVTIKNRSHLTMLNGTGLAGQQFATQGVGIMKHPQNGNQYFMFYVARRVGYNGGITGVAYSLIDMSLDGGMGAVVQKNVKLLDSTSEKLCLVKHCKTDDFWVVTHKWDTNAFYAYPVNASGIGSPVISYVGLKHYDAGSNNNDEAGGVLKASPDGRKLASAIYDVVNRVELFDFDNSTGVVSNGITLNSTFIGYPYGLSFSPSSSRLYLCTNGKYAVYQYDISLGSPSAIIASRITIDSSASTLRGAMQLGPDKRIYIAKPNDSHLDVIENPDKKGMLCGFVNNGITLNKMCDFGLPMYYENQFVDKDFDLGNDTAFCGNGPVNLSVNSQQKFRFSWNTGDTTPDIKATTKGTYIVHAFNGCFSYYDTINLEFNPIPFTSLVDSEQLCYDSVATLTINTDASQILWETNSSSAPSITVSSTGKYRVTVTNSFGCSATDSTKVYNDNCPSTFHVPSAFTPNNDNINDIFIPQYGFIDSIEITIYNRWGEKVFETTRLGVGWDGRLNGDMSPEGLYYYIITYRATKKIRTLNGNVMLVK